MGLCIENVDTFELSPDPLLLMLMATVPEPFPFGTGGSPRERVGYRERGRGRRLRRGALYVWRESFYESSSRKEGGGDVDGSEREREILISVITVYGGEVVNVDHPSLVPTKKGRDVRGERNAREMVSTKLLGSNDVRRCRGVLEKHGRDAEEG